MPATKKVVPVKTAPKLKAPKPLKITEAKIEAKVVAFCKKHGLYCRKFTSPSNRGVPDRVIGRKGLVMFLELKSKGNVPTPLQYKELQSLAAHGLCATWADNYEEAVKHISKFFKLEGASLPQVAVETPAPETGSLATPERQEIPAKTEEPAALLPTPSVAVASDPITFPVVAAADLI